MRLVLSVILALQACALDDEVNLSEIEEDVVVVTNARGWAEMESASTNGGMQIQNDLTGASQGKYLAVTGPGYGRLFLDVHEAADYNVWMRVRAPVGATLDVEVHFRTAHWWIPPTADWTWLPVDAVGDVEDWSLSQGTHELRVTAERAGAQIDRVVICDRWFRPVAKVFEAEEGSVLTPMRIASQKLPPAKFAWVPNGAGTGGRLDLDLVNVWGSPTPYRLWGRANAPSTSDNKFLVNLDGRSGGSSWEPPVTSGTGWTWSRMPSVLLENYPVLSINQGEDGAKLDKILITNDDNFTLVEASPPPQSTL